jgi:hypothetical protein
VPIERPNKFEMAVNKATKALQLTIPNTLLANADALTE